MPIDILRHPRLRYLLPLSALAGILLALLLWSWLQPAHAAGTPAMHRHVRWAGVAFLLISAGTIHAVVLLTPPYPSSEGDGRGAVAGFTLAGIVAVAVPVALYHTWRGWGDPLLVVFWALPIGAFLLLGLATYTLRTSIADALFEPIELTAACATIVLVILSQIR